MSGTVGKSSALTTTRRRCWKSTALSTAATAAETEALTPILPGGAPMSCANLSAQRATLGIHSDSQGLPCRRQDSMNRLMAASTGVHSGACEHARSEEHTSELQSRRDL